LADPSGGGECWCALGLGAGLMLPAPCGCVRVSRVLCLLRAKCRCRRTRAGTSLGRAVLLPGRRLTAAPVGSRRPQSEGCWLRVCRVPLV